MIFDDDRGQGRANFGYVMPKTSSESIAIAGRAGSGIRQSTRGYDQKTRPINMIPAMHRESFFRPGYRFYFMSAFDPDSTGFKFRCQNLKHVSGAHCCRKNLASFISDHSQSPIFKESDQVRVREALQSRAQMAMIAIMVKECLHVAIMSQIAVT